MVFQIKQLKCPLQAAGELVANVVIAFESMLDQLSWMDAVSKREAYNKISNLVKNVAYPDFVLDDAALTQAYAGLNFANPDDYFSILADLRAFTYSSTWAAVLLTGNANRTDFNGPPSIMNAWYQPQLNSITFPIGFMQEAFFDPDWPVSVNYGAFGVVAGHELTHGFGEGHFINPKC